ncbi:transmembrane 6 superfamily member 1-like isoform X1 [Dreissena polymorpha]|uniref:EXPERA domain-containing protein n=1 Tax=Dreissena polymorpha TaxID=45954 RepID=A0A9D4QMB5_DREPO|nr:transmembrane 6 superfamily member 1-like isoform X1 [Dreissena polymorpha]KAH3836219.1 hypothetical protein DPMN_109590 [Dreissena polymorpha]
MSLKRIPVVLLVFATSFLAAPLIYSLDKLAVMEDQRWVFASGVITLPLFGLICVVIARDSPGKNEPLFYVFGIFSFTAVVDLFIALELDGYVKGFMEFYLREGEPYLRSSYGTLINWWDGTGHFSMYTGMIALMCSGKDYRRLGLYWVGSIMNSMIVFLPGNMTGNKGIRWSYLLNVPYIFYPVYAGVRFIKEGFNKKQNQFKGKHTWEKVIEYLFMAWFFVASGICMFRMVACMGCKDWIAVFYVDNIEPFLLDPTQYGKLQSVVYVYVYVPYFIAALCSLIYPDQTWIKDWSLVFAGGSMQAQLVYICCSLKWRTPEQHQVPDTALARAVFWPVNLSLVIVPHLFAIYCHREELRSAIQTKVSPFFQTIASEVETSRKTTKKISVPVAPRNGPVTRQQKKNI